MSEIAKSAETGQFLPGNPWRFPLGNSGRLPSLTASGVSDGMTEYVDRRIIEDKPLTWAGLALHLGITRAMLDRYHKGEVKNVRGGAAIVSMLSIFRTAMEAQMEERLPNKEYATSGLALIAKNLHGWTDSQHVEHTGQAPIQIAITSDSPLRGRLERAGVIVEQVDG